MTWPPAPASALISFAAASSTSSLRPVMYTFAPLVAKPAAMAEV